jgi:hypothetical protein
MFRERPRQVCYNAYGTLQPAVLRHVECYCQSTNEYARDSSDADVSESTNLPVTTIAAVAAGGVGAVLLVVLILLAALRRRREPAAFSPDMSTSSRELTLEWDNESPPNSNL